MQNAMLLCQIRPSVQCRYCFYHHILVETSF